MQLILNGSQVSVDPEPGESLLEVLRERLGLRSMKDGCAPEGSCGACTVIVDGRAVVSCAQPAVRVAGRHVTTLEGLSPLARAAWADSFAVSGAAQCGFCSPGIVMKAHALLERDAAPSREEIARALAGNLCRCTGYVKVIDAVERAAATLRGEPVPAADAGGGVGSRTVRHGARALALGEQPFVNDMAVPGMLHAALRFADHPRAVVRRIDTSLATPCAGRARDRHRRGRPRGADRRADRPRLAGVRRRGRDDAMRRRRHRRGCRADPPRGAGGGGPGRGGVRGAPPGQRSVRRARARRSSDPPGREPARDLRRSARRCGERARSRPPTSCATASRPARSSTRSSSRRRAWRCRSPRPTPVTDGPVLRPLLAGPGRLGRSAPGRGAPRPPGARRPGQPGRDRRRLRRQGGPVRPGPGRAARAAHGSPRAAGVVAGGEPASPPQAPCADDGLRGRLRRRGSAGGRSGADRR